MGGVGVAAGILDAVAGGPARRAIVRSVDRRFYRTERTIAAAFIRP
jgi:hypothetical protein